MQNLRCFNDLIDSFSAQTARRRTVWDIPGPGPALPILGTRWIYSVFGRYNLNKIHEAYRGEYKASSVDLCQQFEAHVLLSRHEI